jgi:flagellar biosynthesis protein FlhF
MNLRTFKAYTMADCLSLVKGEMGPTAMILHTRTYYQRYWLGLRRREIVEITAGRGEARRRPGHAPEAMTQQAQRKQVTNYAGALANSQAAVAAQAAAAAGIPGRQLLETPAATNAITLGLSKEVSELKLLVKSLVGEVRHGKTPDVPEELFDHYMKLIENQVAAELAMEIVKNVQRSVRPEHLQQADFIREKIAEQLEKHIPIAGPIVKTKTSGPHVVALIGPTGVGKTTTIAKLAANLKLREHRKVGLITIDTYRIAAIDQLKKYADIIGSPLRVVGNADDLREAVAAMSDCEFILIDTAGRSPKDSMKLGELKGFIEAAKADEVHLVISTAASQESAELAIERFSEVRCDKIIFTKLDEAAHVGMMLNVVRKVNKALSYVTVGQDVPDDIEVGHGRKLAQRILGM